jgi:hypothetical protein
MTAQTSPLSTGEVPCHALENFCVAVARRQRHGCEASVMSGPAAGSHSRAEYFLFVGLPGLMVRLAKLTLVGRPFLG